MCHLLENQKTSAHWPLAGIRNYRVSGGVLCDYYSMQGKNVERNINSELFTGFLIKKDIIDTAIDLGPKATGH